MKYLTLSDAEQLQFPWTLQELQKLEISVDDILRHHTKSFSTVFFQFVICAKEDSR